MKVVSEKVMFLLADKLSGAEVSANQRPQLKIAMISSNKSWVEACNNWIHDIIGPRLKTFPAISSAAPDTRACPLTMNHPNCLVLLEGVDNSDAIQDFLNKNRA